MHWQSLISPNLVHITVYIFITYYIQKVSIYYKRNIVWTKFIKYIFIIKLKHTAWKLLILPNSIILQKKKQTESLKLAKSRTWRIYRILGSHPPLMAVDLISPFLRESSASRSSIFNYPIITHSETHEHILWLMVMDLTQETESCQ